MFNWVKQLFKTGVGDVIRPTPPVVQEQPVREPVKHATTWEERAAAVGALSGPGLTATCEPLKSKPVEPRSSNPLQLRGAALSNFLSQPGGQQRYEAAERTKKELGSVDGRHYSQYVAEVKRLMKAGDHSAAIELLERLVAATEAEAAFSGDSVPPWYGTALKQAKSRLDGAAPVKKRPKRKP